MFQVHIDEQILNIRTLTGIALYVGFIICNICLFTLWCFAVNTDPATKTSSVDCLHRFSRIFNIAKIGIVVVLTFVLW